MKDDLPIGLDSSTLKQSSPPKIFRLPVDGDDKATVFHPLSASAPHMRAFHLAWLSLFSCFFSTFSIPPLLPIIRADLNLSASDISAAGAASFIGSVFSRLLMGPICDVLGPRRATATLSLLTAPVVLSASLITSSQSFILLRFLIGFSLANFVSSQFWMSSMFSGCVVGRANAVVAGWANVGSGLAQIIMPIVYSFLTYLVSPSLAWRLTFILPALLLATTAIVIIIYGQDTPQGNYNDIKRSKTHDRPEKSPTLFKDVLFGGLGNYRGWILALTYGYCFGVELTMDNNIAEYFYYRFHLNLETAGAVAAAFGLTNIFSRPAGGLLSDAMGNRYGMRGRLWSLWVVQTMAGLLCVWLGRVNSFWGSIVVMCGFSVLVQAASGLTFGVVPFVSKRSLGVISGMTGSGGTVGAAVSELLFFSGSRFPTQMGISLMGIMMIACALPIFLIYFPQWGGMFCGPPSTDELYHLLE